MRRTLRFQKSLITLCCLALSLFAALLPARGATSDKEILKYIDELRGIEPTDSKARLEQLNAKMDSAWTYLKAHKEEAAPLIQRELMGELEKPAKDQFFVLDLSYLLVTLKGKEAEHMALKAMASLDTDSKIIQYNFKELFDFTYAVAKFSNPDVLPAIDRIILPNTNKLVFFSAPHMVDLNAADICCFLYGATELDAEAHLLAVLDGTTNSTSRLNIIRTLASLGSEKCTPQLAPLLRTSKDSDTFIAVVTVLMSVGGPSGRDAVLKIEPAGLDQKSRAYLERTLPEVKKVSAKAMISLVKSIDSPSAKRYDGEALRKQLQKMYDHYGKDNETNPSSIVTSTLPHDYLLKELKRIRSRTFYRLNNHTFDDVRITNLLINTLQYMGEQR